MRFLLIAAMLFVGLAQLPSALAQAPGAGGPPAVGVVRAETRPVVETNSVVRSAPLGLKILRPTTRHRVVLSGRSSISLARTVRP